MQEPYVAHLQVSAICSRNCPFCGEYTTPTHKIDDPFMDIDLAREVAKDLEWAAPLRIHFFLNGESLLHPNFLEFVRAVREERPESWFLMYTNGDMLLEGKYNVEEVLKAGMNSIVIDSYDNEMANFVENMDYDVMDFDQKYSHYRRSPDEKYVMHMDNSEGFNRDIYYRCPLNNRAGNVDREIYREKYGQTYPKHPLEKMCAAPSKRLSISHDGHVTLCQLDHKYEAVYGKFPEQSTKEIYNSRPYKIARKLLLQGKRYLLPCHRCDWFGGYRPGLFEEPEVNMENWEEVIIEQLHKYGDKCLVDRDEEDFIKKRNKKLTDLLK